MTTGVSTQNVTTYLHVAEVFNLANVARETTRLVASCFAAVSGSKNFLQLGLSSVKKILSSSELHVDSELEVMEAAQKWLTHERDERREFTKKLFMKIRISLLPDEVLKKIFSKSHFTRSAYVFQENEECVQAVREALTNKPNCKNNTRFCSQSEFSVLFIGGMDTRKNTIDYDVIRVDGEKFDDARRLTKFPECDYILAVNVQSQFYLFTFDKSRKWISARKYNFGLNTWKTVSYIEHSAGIGFRLCAFIDGVYFIGGCRGKDKRTTNRCFRFDTDTFGTKSIAKMLEAREFAASCAFQGKVVVSGGSSTHRFGNLRTCEAYCHISNEWTGMPDMIHARSNHCLIPMRSRLYAVGGLTSEAAEACEVYDVLSGRFSLVKGPAAVVGGREAFSAGEKIFVFMHESSKVAVFDTERNKWSEETLEVTKHLKNYVCLKIPKIY